MAKLGKLNWVVQNTAGTALSGVSVEVRKQGATVNGDQAGSPVTVNNPGGIAVNDIITINVQTTPTRTVSAVTATVITTTGGPLGTVNDDDRLTVINNLPTLYNDSASGESKSNPLTTDSNGTVTAWVEGGYYDIHVSGGSATTTLYTDVFVGAEQISSNEFDAAAAVAFVRDTERTLSTAGAVLEEWRNAGDAKARIGYDGGFTASGSVYIHDNLTASGTVVASGIVANSSVSFPAGSITTTMFAASAVHSAYGATTSAASATVASGSATVRASVTWTPTQGNLGAIIFGQANYDYNTGALGERLAIDIVVAAPTPTVYTTVTPAGNLSTAPGIVQACAAALTSSLATGAVATATLEDQRRPGSLGGVCEYRGDYGAARLVVVELKR